MTDERNHGKRAPRARSIILLALFVASFLASAGLVAAADLRVVGGYVETVSGTYLFLRGKSYDIGGAPVEHTSGKMITADQIARGNKVDLFFRGGRITTVLVYEPMPE